MKTQASSCQVPSEAHQTALHLLIKTVTPVKQPHRVLSQRGAVWGRQRLRECVRLVVSAAAAPWSSGTQNGRLEATTNLFRKTVFQFNLTQQAVGKAALVAATVAAKTVGWVIVHDRTENTVICEYSWTLEPKGPVCGRILLSKPYTSSSTTPLGSFALSQS